MEVTFLGSGDAFGHGGRLQACILVRDAGHSLLLDCGATSLVALSRAGVDPSSIDAVVVSHFHLDHDGGLPLLVLAGQFARRERPLTIAGPAGIADRTRALMETAFEGSSATRQRYEIRYEPLDLRPRAIGPHAVTAVPVRHTPGAQAVGIRIAGGSAVVAYTGDTEWDDALVGLAEGADLLVAEAYTFTKRVPYHLDHASLVANSARLGARRTVLTHPGPEMLAHAAGSAFPLVSDGSRYVLGKDAAG